MPNQETSFDETISISQDLIQNLIDKVAEYKLKIDENNIIIGNLEKQSLKVEEKLLKVEDKYKNRNKEIDDYKKKIKSLEEEVKEVSKCKQLLITKLEEDIKTLKEENYVLKNNRLQFTKIGGLNRLIQTFLEDGVKKYRIVL